jgi:hypothetical protein
MTKFELYAFVMRCLASDTPVDPTAGEAVADPTAGKAVVDSTAGEAVVGDWGADMMVEMVSVAEEQSATDLSLLDKISILYLCSCFGQNANASCLHVRNCRCNSRFCNLI